MKLSTRFVDKASVMSHLVYVRFHQVKFFNGISALFATSKCTPIQRAVALELSNSAYSQLLERFHYVMNELGQKEVIPFDVEHISGVGR